MVRYAGRIRNAVLPVAWIVRDLAGNKAIIEHTFLWPGLS